MYEEIICNICQDRISKKIDELQILVILPFKKHIDLSFLNGNLRQISIRIFSESRHLFSKYLDTS